MYYNYFKGNDNNWHIEIVECGVKRLVTWFIPHSEQDAKHFVDMMNNKHN